MWKRPLFAIILLATVFIGLVIGAFAVWWDQGRFRRAAREGKRALAKAAKGVEAERSSGLPRLR